MINHKQGIPSRTYMFLVLLFAVLLGILLGLSLTIYAPVRAQEPITCPQVCPACNVKAEWTGEVYEYEYTDGTAVITGTTPISVCWQAQGSYRVSSVCVKAGQMLFHPDPSLGCWTTPYQDISHIVVCTEKATAIGLVSFHASAPGGFNVMLFLTGCVGMMLGLCIIAWAERKKA